MRILFITPYIPSLIRVRPYNFIRALAKRGHELSLICLVQAQNELREVPRLREYCEDVEAVYLRPIRSMVNCLAYLPLPVSLQAAYCFTRRMNQRVTRPLREKHFDVVHVEHIRASRFLEAARDVPSVFDSVDCITSLYEQFSRDKPSRVGRWTSRIEYYKLRAYEPTEASKFDRVIVTSQKDKRDLQRLAPHLTVDVISNGVDAEYYRPREGPREGAEVVFWGKMSYYANESAAAFLCKELLPRIRTREPGTRVTIVGSSPSRSLRRFASRDGIDVTGYVPDIRVYLRKARVAAFPIRAGAGIQNKVLEALALGIPVVATSKACQALSVLHGEHLLIADDPDEFAAAVIRIIDDDHLAEKLARDGRRYVEENHDWDDKARQLEETYQGAIVSARDRTINAQRKSERTEGVREK